MESVRPHLLEVLELIKAHDREQLLPRPGALSDSYYHKLFGQLVGIFRIAELFLKAFDDLLSGFISMLAAAEARAKNVAEVSPAAGREDMRSDGGEVVRQRAPNASAPEVVDKQARRQERARTRELAAGMAEKF
jgi:hypothetical protein